MYIKNKEELISHGLVREREAAIGIMEQVLQAADPYRATMALVSLSGNRLRVGPLEYDLTQRGRIYLLGTGKATYPIAKALEDILGERICDGVVILKRGYRGKLAHVRVREASHPLPDEKGHMAAQEMMDMAVKAQKGDLVFCAITGGSSALAPLPVNGVSLADKRRINELLLYSGAAIQEINAVRKHLSRIKGGNLAKAIFPAEVINLTVSDVIGDPLDYITDPTVPDTSTFADAVAVLHKYKLWEAAPLSVRHYLETATPARENPRHFGNQPLHTFLLIKSDVVCEAAVKAAPSFGFQPLVLTSTLEGESRDAGTFFAAVARETQNYGRPLPPPCAIICGGETTVTIPDQLKGRGEGGPNQEFVLSAALGLRDNQRVLIAAIDTDGTDGPTELAGGMIDFSSLAAAREKGLDIFEALRAHNVSATLRALGDAVITGHTGTNVNDLKIMLVLPPA
jgi:glycerate 2-kinase